MGSSQKFFVPRFAMAGSLPYVLAGIGMLGGGALLGNYLGQQAAARSVVEVGWIEQDRSPLAGIRRASLLRSPVGGEVAFGGKDQDRVAADADASSSGTRDRVMITKQKDGRSARVVIRAPEGNRRKNDFLASVVPTVSVDDLLGRSGKRRSETLAPRLVSLGRDPGDDLTTNQRVPRPGRLMRPGTDLIDTPEEFLSQDSGGQEGDAPPSPPAAKLAAMAERGAVARVAYAEQAKAMRAEENCLAQAIYFEARGEPTLGQIAVAGVVMNRVASSRYPDTICGVVYQNQHMRNACQFSFACDGKAEVASNAKLWRQAKRLAKGFVEGTKMAHVIRDATHYHADYVSPDWAPKMRKIRKIGRHIFYTPETRVASN